MENPILQRGIMKIIAKDNEGKEYEKDVVVDSSLGCRILWFGGPAQYNLDDPENIIRHYPFTENYYIDFQGRNHGGSPVYITKEDMNKIFEELVFKKK